MLTLFFIKKLFKKSFLARKENLILFCGFVFITGISGNLFGLKLPFPKRDAYGFTHEQREVLRVQLDDISYYSQFETGDMIENKNNPPLFLMFDIPSLKKNVFTQHYLKLPSKKLPMKWAYFYLAPYPYDFKMLKKLILQKTCFIGQKTISVTGHSEYVYKIKLLLAPNQKYCIHRLDKIIFSIF